MKKHFVIFMSPGTFVAETTEKEIDSWDVDKAVKLAKNINERYNARPYGFHFVTRGRGPKDLDSKVIKRSGTYYLGGRVMTLAELKKENDPEKRILISNMECNHWDKVIENTNSYRWTQQLEKGDVVLEGDFFPKKKGN